MVGFPYSIEFTPEDASRAASLHAGGLVDERTGGLVAGLASMGIEDPATVASSIAATPEYGHLRTRSGDTIVGVAAGRILLGQLESIDG